MKRSFVNYVMYSRYTVKIFELIEFNLISVITIRCKVIFQINVDFITFLETLSSFGNTTSLKYKKITVAACDVHSTNVIYLMAYKSKKCSSHLIKEMSSIWSIFIYCRNSWYGLEIYEDCRYERGF